MAYLLKAATRPSLGFDVAISWLAVAIGKAAMAIGPLDSEHDHIAYRAAMP